MTDRFGKADMDFVNWHPRGQGWNQLHLAASNGDLETLRERIKISKNDKEDAKLSILANRESKLDIPIKTGDRAIHLALRKGQAGAAKALILAGCDVKALGSGGVSICSWA